jgi:hypothetical protein
MRILTERTPCLLQLQDIKYLEWKSNIQKTQKIYCQNFFFEVLPKEPGLSTLDL